MAGSNRKKPIRRCMFGRSQSPPQDWTGGNIKHTAHLYVFVPMFSVDNDQNPNDAMPCPNGGRPGELCGPALGGTICA